MEAIAAAGARDHAGPAPPSGPSAHARTARPSAPEIEIEPPPYTAGDVIGSKYQLTSILGEGGMGAVWLARNLALDMDVAVKLIRRDMATPETEQRLLVEARAMARLDHASIVRIYDFGETEYGDPFIVMEVLHGESLGDVLTRVGRLPAENAVQTILPVGSALAAVHGKGIIHRDLKPDNIVLTTTEGGSIVPKVVDFGVAKLDLDDVDRKATRVGTVVGSPDYLSPEQARGDEVDERVDVWALSVVLYEAMTGRLPFSGANYHALLRAIIEDVPAPTTAFEAGDAALWSIIARGLAKNAEARWPSMRAYGKALAEWAIARGIEHDIGGVSLRAHWLLETEGRMPVGSLPSESDLLLVPPAVRAASSDQLAAALAHTAHALPAPMVAAAPSPLLGMAPAPSPAAQVPPAAVAAPVPAPAPAPVAAPAPVPVQDDLSIPDWPPRRKGWVGPLLALTIVGALGVGGYLYRDPLRALATEQGLLSDEAAPAASASASGSSALAAAPSTSARPPASAPSASASAAAAGKPARSEAEINQCALPMFAEGTFTSEHPPKVASMCAETDPRRGSAAMKEQVMRAKKGALTPAMKEWAALGWYELAAFAVIRAKCCIDPAALELPAPGAGCKPVDDTLDALGRAAVSGLAVELAVAAYGKELRCALKTGGGKAFGIRRPVQPTEEAEFRKTLRRVRGTRPLPAPAPTSTARTAPRPAPKRK